MAPAARASASTSAIVGIASGHLATAAPSGLAGAADRVDPAGRELGERAVGDEPAAVRGAVERRVVERHRHAVAREPRVDRDDGAPRAEGRPERRQRVLAELRPPVGGVRATIRVQDGDRRRGDGGQQAEQAGREAAAHAAHIIGSPMRRSLHLLALTALALALSAPAALAAEGHDGGEGWWGETNDKVVTNAGFIIIAAFPVLVFC